MRTLLTLALYLAVGLGLVSGALAVLGYASWGAAGWYYPWNNDPDYRLRCGQEALRRGNAPRTEQVALLLEADGYKDHAALLRGELYFRQAKPYADADEIGLAAPLLNRAITELNKIRDQGDLNFQAVVVLGQCFVYMRQTSAAEHALLYVLHKDPNHIDAHRGLAALYYDQGAVMRAVQHLDKVTELDPKDGRPYCLLGQIYKDLEQYDDALRCYREALGRELRGRNGVLDPAAIHKNMAECLVKQRKYAEALDVLQTQFEPLPADAAAAAALKGECLHALSRDAEAATVLDAALAAYSDNADLYRVRAQLSLESKEPRAAVELLEKALRADRADIASRTLLVTAYQHLNEPAKVAEQQRLLEQLKKDLEEFSALNRRVLNDPNAWDVSLRLRLAELAGKLGKQDLEAMWRRAAASCPPTPALEPAKRSESEQGYK